MREIKFRAWDKVGKKLWTVTSIQFANNQGFIASYGLGVDFVFMGTDKDGNIFRGSSVDCDLMQYTGRKDKNGVEIYEGDILHWQWTAGDDEVNDLNKGDFVVVWKYGSWQLDIPAGVPMPPIAGLWKSIDDMETENEQTYEVVGNIYANPELVQ